MADDIAATTTTAGEDERRLHELGYAQELMRRMSGFSNFAVSFTIISILSGCLTLYGYGMNTGGPAMIVWGWPIVGIMVIFVGLAMAEVCSSFPTAGGLYYWAAKLAPNSRMIYAFSRDGALPGSNIWHQVNKRTRTPTNAIWLAAGGALILGLPYLWNSTAYAAVTSIAVIGLYIAYVTPTYLRLRQGENFKRGPWHLGRWSYVVGWIAVVWVAFITILFMLPTVSPIGWGNFNYTVVAVIVVLGFAWVYWMVSAKNWFKGPKVQGTPEELAAIERELSA